MSAVEYVLAQQLVQAGATHASAARAAVIIDAGGTVDEARAVLEQARVPASFDGQLLLAELERIRVLAVTGAVRAEGENT